MKFGKTALSALVLFSSSYLVQGKNDKPAKPPHSNNGSGRDTGPVQIGSHNAIRISSDEALSEIQPIISRNGRRKTYSLKHEGASYLSVHFSNMELAPSCSLEITDASGDQYVMMRGRGRADQGTFWARHVKGNSVEIIVQCNGKNNVATFDIDDYVAGYPDANAEKTEDRFLRRSSFSRAQMEPLFPFRTRDLSICSADDKMNAVCYKDSHPVEYERARAVARLYINGSGACTGWLVGSENTLVTNEHCIASLSDVLNTDFEFMGEEATCGSTSGDCWMCDRGLIFDGLALLQLSPNHDMALVKIDGNPTTTYGSLDLDTRPVVNGEEIYIPQHPGGRAKELGIEDSSTSPSGVCRVLNSDTGCCGCDGSYQDVRYTCDTEGGSSGSPVLARSSHRVVGLHHCGGGCEGNMGVPVESFIDQIVQDVYPNGIPNFDDQETPTEDPDCAHDFEVRMDTDQYGEETTWEVRDTDGNLLATQAAFLNGGTGELADSTPYSYSVCVPDGELTFTITDSYGDGICCLYGEGKYSLYYDGDLVHEANGDFGSFETKTITPPSCKVFELELVTDNFPGETKWFIRDSAGQVVISGEGYQNPGAASTISKCLDSTMQYEFTIEDSYGDGICCGNGNGSYRVFYDGALINQGGAFAALENFALS